MVPKKITRTIRLSAAALLAGLIAMPGCEDEPIRAYQAPKAPAYVAPSLITAPTASDAEPTTARWDKPPAWEQDTGPSSMAFAVFDVPDEAGPARVTATALSGKAGGVLANINRWRGQGGLEPVKVIEDQPMTAVKAEHFLAGLVDLSAPADAGSRFERMLIVLIPRREENRTWFIKMTGPTQTVDRHKDEFVGFVESMRFDEGTP